MVINSESPIKDIGEGFGKGIGEALINKHLDTLINKFKDGKLAFIQERTTIDKARELLKSKEHNFYCTYIQNETKRTLAVIGLTLRRLDSENLQERRENLVKKIRKKYLRKDLHLCYLVQNGVLTRYIANLLERVDNGNLFQERLNEFLENLEKYVYFVRAEQESVQVADTIKTKIVAGNPETFIISGMGSAIDVLSNSFNLIKKEISIEYEWEKYSGKKRKIIILDKKEFL